MSTTATLNPAIVGQAEKHHAAILSRVLSGTTLDEQRWITLNQTLAAGAPVARAEHIVKIATMTRWTPESVADAVSALLETGLLASQGDRIEVTDAGRALVARVRADSGRIVDAAYGSVSPEDLATAARVLTVITARMAEELARA
ncbi:helix-turn-helix domain-containing protein [Nocardia seriolae]|uniref:Uncharacterized protein n=1 Tax=Nocardia seriolae TaxID=37332 RepID=A0A0B8NAX7_9NOCA|nr:hypothetical protein [Nocardia seriolae]APA94178.1 hypothetical protein NS506_00091 [Nocardia seriolae]MTJ60604.1 MarR family transcriptional regulator [Nocardia seriolae]MTJ74047.1 MarR family transcriptional regulator [Nocardia seriolae]MTJ84525.1 MarR family transcriptional regulator [Nocardia seriolae]MTK28512.1 MarR family transcriptional regulator [Nocardia seriolae]